MRAGSKTYGKWFGIELTEENKKQFLISEGFAHGLLVLSEMAEFCYKCDDSIMQMMREDSLGMTRILVLSGRNLKVFIKEQHLLKVIA